MKDNKFFNIPIFKNPNIDSSSLSESKIINNIGLSENNSNNNKTSGVNLPIVLDSINSLKNLVFFKKKGNIKANPYTIGYSFNKSSGAQVKALSVTQQLKSGQSSPTSLGGLNQSMPYLRKSLWASVPGIKAVKGTNAVSIYKGTKSTRAGSASKITLKDAYFFENNEINNLLIRFFKGMYCLISRPFFIFTPDVVKIQLFYFVAIPKYLSVIKGLKKRNKRNSRLREQYWDTKSKKVQDNLINLAKKNIINVYPNRFVILANILSRIFNRTVELELIRLHQPYLDTNILVRFAALFINKRNISVWIKRLFNNNSICSKEKPSYISSTGQDGGDLGFNFNNNDTKLHKNFEERTSALLSGLKIKISGRLMKEPIIPKVTTKKFEKGFTARGKVNYLEVAKLTHKNRKGAFTITIKSGQNFK